jgi:23S rRNA (uracil1939-C5)-methyltransferase
VGQGVRNGPELTGPLTIEKLVPGGAGFCRLPDGRSAFVEGALPGEQVRLRTFEHKKGYVRARAFELVEPSAERVVPACPIAEACGGCDWMHLELTAQRQYKSRLVAEALERTGGLRLPVLPEVVTRGDALGYRSRLRVHVDHKGSVGFFGRRTRVLVPVPACAVAHPALNRALVVLSGLGAAERKLLSAFDTVELAALANLASVDARLWPRADARPPRSIAPLVERLEVEDVSVRIAPVGGTKGPPAAEGERPWSAFLQVNPAVNDALVAAVIERATGARTFLDLYAGSGNFSLPLAAGGRSGVLVELDRTAAESARREAAARGLSLEVLALDAARALPRLAARAGEFEFVVLDPPRAGAREAISGIIALGPRLIAYVSCDPVTLARDLKELASARYELRNVQCFDMFPQTHHVETLAFLVRT